MMKLHKMSKEQYIRWCDSEQGKAFNKELIDYLDGVDEYDPKGQYDALKYVKKMFEREVNIDGRID